jgi:hypothetical protein
MWQDSFGSAFPVAPGAWGDNERSCFWFTRNYTRMYLMPKPSLLSIPSGGQRFSVDGGVVGGATGTFSGGANAPTYGLIDAAALNFTTLSLRGYMSTAAKQLSQGWTVLVGIPLQNGTQQAMLVKAIGIDHWYFDWFDAAAYRIETVGEHTNDHRRRLRVPSTAGVAFASKYRSVGPFTLPDVWAAMAGSAANMEGHSVRPGPASFQFRNLVTNRVSPFATAQLDWIWRKRLVPLAAIIRNHPGR